MSLELNTNIAFLKNRPIAALISAVTARRLLVAPGVSLEKRARHIIKEELELHAEPLS